MNMISGEEVESLRERYPPGSRVLLRGMTDDPFPIPPGTAGTLNFIDDLAQFHISWDNGRSLAVIYGVDRFDITPPSMTALKLYSPMTADMYEYDERTGASDDAVELSGSDLLEFQDEIEETLTRQNIPEEAERGIMHWYNADDSINRKVHSVTFHAEYRSRQIWCVADCRIIGKLTDDELGALKRYVSELLSEGFGEGMESAPVSIGRNKLYIHLWQADGNWSVKTEQERFESAPVMKQPETARERRSRRNLPVMIHGKENKLKKIFEAELTHPPEERSEASATLSLPATPYELRDALDKLRIQKGRRVSVEILSIAPDVRFLTDYIKRGTCDVTTLHLLNALAEKISRINSTERRAFEGMVLAELEKNSEAIPAAKLYDLASSVDRCHVADVSDDESLGRFYVDGGFLPEYGNLPERILENLNYAKIGAEAREGEGGVFVPGGGYVIQHEEFAEASKDFVPEEPDYAVLMEVRRGESAALLKLPASQQEMDAALDAVGAEDWSDAALRCLDCKVPVLCDAVTETGSVAHADRAARILRDLPDEKRAMYKAVLVRGASPIWTTRLT